MNKYNMKSTMYLLRGVILVFLLAAFCSCPAKAQVTSSADMAKAFAEAGMPLLKQGISSREFSLPPVWPETQKENLSLGALKGKVVFLNFWATWCGPCRAEMPSMEALHGRYREKGLEILAVNCGESKEQVQTFMKNNGLTFTAVLDTDGKASGSYGIQAIPTSFLIDREGKIIARLVGSINWDTPKIREAFELLLK